MTAPGTLAHVTTFTLPSTPEAADELLSGLGALATATEWKRAAIVHARTTPKGKHSTSGKLSAAKFAELGIVGLASPSTVIAYRDVWQSAVDAGLARPAELGAEVGLPDVPWDDHYKPPGGGKVPIARRDRGLKVWVPPNGVMRGGVLFAAEPMPDLFGEKVPLLPTPTATDGERDAVHPDIRRECGTGKGRIVGLPDVAVASVVRKEPAESTSRSRCSERSAP